MPSQQISVVLEHLRNLVGASADETPDSQLLERLVSRQDEAAFEALLSRHGPMVLGVCQRVLRDAHDVEDAFQATFLVFVRKVRSIKQRERLAPWLYGIAFRTALKARALRRHHRELPGEGVDMSVERVLDEVTRREARAVLDTELMKLPEKYRVPVILCYLEGKSKDEVARKMDWPHGTVSSRLSRALELLRRRLGRRGLALSGIAAGTVLSQTASPAAVPSELLAITMKSGLILMASQTLTGSVVSTAVANLTQKVLRTMLLTKLKLVALWAISVSVVTMGTALLAQGKLFEPRVAIVQGEPFHSFQDKSEPKVATVASTGKNEEPKTKAHSISGSCLNDADRLPLGGITVKLYKVEGLTSPPVEIASTVTNADGRYTFTGLVPPRPENHLDHLSYGVLGFAADRPIGISFIHFRDGKEVVELRMTREKSTLSGKVIDAEGRPVAGATLLQCFVYNRPVPGLLSATTDAAGRFKLDNVGIYKWPDGKAVPTNFTVVHQDHPKTSSTANELPANVVVSLPASCLVMGTVTDSVTGQPSAGAMITARRVDEWNESFFATDAAGRFRLVVPEGRYDFLAEAKDRVCVALTGRECLAGEKVELPPFTLIRGGFISGQVVNTVTGQSVSISERGDPVMLGFVGPSQPAGPVISPIRLAAVDKTGRFILRAAPGENFPYFINTRGVRMAWDTQKQPPVVVKDGETAAYNMLITPEVSPKEKLNAARKLVEALSKQPSGRTAQILFEFRKLNHTVDETELWCLLMRELVAIGREAVPQLCAELDQTTENRMLRRLGFALRAIGDARAVPALIRVIPKTLLPASSDYGLIVNDKGLADFMQTHHLAKRGGGMYFDLGRPEREIIGALHGLSGQDFADAELFSMSLSEDPRRQVLQRRIYLRQAQRWQVWWEANWRKFTDDSAYQKVNLNVLDEPLPPAPQALGKTARLNGVWTGAVLSPAIQEGEHAWHFYDLDTGFRPIWPTGIPRNETSHNLNQLADWASRSGVDLMCITHRSTDGTETYVLRALGMKVREISLRDLRNLDKLIAAGTLPEGRPVGDLLMHYDTQSQQFVPDANAAFLFVTREGSMGLIETTDRVTRTANLSGMAGSPPPGVGFHKGVQFNLKEIIP